MAHEPAREPGASTPEVEDIAESAREPDEPLRDATIYNLDESGPFAAGEAGAQPASGAATARAQPGTPPPDDVRDLVGRLNPGIETEIDDHRPSEREPDPPRAG